MLVAASLVASVIAGIPARPVLADPPGTAPDFTVVTIPDTQFYSESYPATFTAQTTWIRDSAGTLEHRLRDAPGRHHQQRHSGRVEQRQRLHAGA